MSTPIRVNPPSIRSFVSQTEEKLTAIQRKLVAMLDETVQVNYTGEHAVEFKSGCADIAVNYSNALIQDLKSIVSSVNSATEAIKATLGAARETLDMQASPLSKPAIPQGDGSYNADLTLLETLSQTIAQSMNEIEGLLGEQLEALRKTDWTGNAKDRAVGEVTRFTNAAKAKTAEARTNMTKYITEQVAALRTADGS